LIGIGCKEKLDLGLAAGIGEYRKEVGDFNFKVLEQTDGRHAGARCHGAKMHHLPDHGAILRRSGDARRIGKEFDTLGKSYHITQGWFLPPM